ncbi:MAG: N-acetyl sugar amidotransferase [Chryseosolibacter sp.]
MDSQASVSDFPGKVREGEICTKTVLDTTVPNITFDENGECNFCRYYEQLAKRTVERTSDVLDREFESIIRTIKAVGQNKEYDCVLGVSGGMDSTYLALLAKRNGLRPLLVHFDNGWNSELAVQNIEKIVNVLGLPLHTYVMDWEEFRDLQRSYFLASVVDVEVPTDQLIFAALHKIAYSKGIKFILAGNNVVTESINPEGWVYKNKLDLVNLRSIHRKFGTRRLTKLPRLGLFERYFYEAVCGIQIVNLLDLVGYNKARVKEEVMNYFGWSDYGGKHHESVFTRFYQGYYLPVKFNIDKRKAHLSNLILSGQLTREEAIRELTVAPYAADDQLSDLEYVKKKLGFSDAEWSWIMEASPVPHAAFPTDRNTGYQVFYKIFQALMYVPVRLLRAIGILYTPRKVSSRW